MGTTAYPGSVDDFATTSPTNLGDDDSTGRTHSERHDDMEAAMEAVQTNAVSKTLIDAKGDLIAGSAADTAARLAAGSNGYVLTAASAEATGLKWSAPGEVLIADSTFSAASSVSVDGCFTADFDAYRIQVTGWVATTADAATKMRLRASSTDDSSASYTQHGRVARGNTSFAYTASTLPHYAYSLTGADAFDLGGCNVGTGFIDIKLENPYAAANTFVRAESDGQQTTNGLQGVILRGSHGTSSSYDGFTLFPSSGTFSGRVRVFGIA